MMESNSAHSLISCSVIGQPGISVGDVMLSGDDVIVVEISIGLGVGWLPRGWISYSA